MGSQGLRKNKKGTPQCPSVSQAFTCISLANIPFAKASHMAWGLGMRELPKGMSTGRTMILSI